MSYPEVTSVRSQMQQNENRCLLQRIIFRLGPLAIHGKPASKMPAQKIEYQFPTGSAIGILISSSMSYMIQWKFSRLTTLEHKTQTSQQRYIIYSTTICAIKNSPPHIIYKTSAIPPHKSKHPSKTHSPTLHIPSSHSPIKNNPTHHHTPIKPTYPTS